MIPVGEDGLELLDLHGLEVWDLVVLGGTLGDRESARSAMNANTSHLRMMRDRAVGSVELFLDYWIIIELTRL
jgi:ribosome biogenesis SPOUT family RNA methylase Rps3